MNDKLTLNEDFDIPGADEASDMLGYDPDAEPTLEDQGWEYVASKDVYDEDGFRDSYMWYRKDGNNRFFFSSDVDYGDPEYFDWETEGDEAAQEWFDSYGEDEDELTFVDNREEAILHNGDDPGFDEYDKVDEAVEDNLTAKAEIDTPRGTFYAYKGTWKDFENEDDRDDWGFWFDHYTDDNKHFKIMHNHIDNSAIAVLKEGLNESKRGFVEKYRGYSIHDAGDRYVITDEKGLNVGETRFGIPVCRGMIDDMIDGKEADKITEAKRTKFPRGFNLGSSNNQNVKVRNPYNYTIQELSINNKAKTFERGNFSMGRADIELKNRQEYEDIVDLLKDQGYTEVKSDYHSLRNKTRKGIREDKQVDSVGKEEARKVFDKGGQVYISNGGKNYWGYDKSSGKTLDDVIKNYYDNQKNLSFMVDHRPLTKDHLLDRIKERRKTVESLDNAEKATKEDILEYAKLHGDRSAADLLLLGGYEFFDGTADEYDALLKELEDKADGEKVDESPDELKTVESKNLKESIASDIVKEIKKAYPQVQIRQSTNHYGTALGFSEYDINSNWKSFIIHLARKYNIPYNNYGMSYMLIFGDTKELNGSRDSEMDSNDNPIDESFNNSSSSYYLTTVGDMIDGSVGNVDDEDIDKDLKFWRTVARTFTFVPGADNVAVLIADGEYDPEYYYPSWTVKPRAIAKKYPNAVFYDVPFFCVKEVKNGKMFLYFDSEESAKKYVDLIDSGVDLEDQDAYTEWTDKHPLMRESLKEDLTPENGEENFVAGRLITAINDEWKTIDLYNSIISELSNTDGDDYKKMIPVIEDIVNEENVHVGQLQKALELISPDTTDIAKGEKEAEGQISGGDPADDKKALVDESCNKTVKESLDDDDIDIDTESERWEDIYEYGDDADDYDDFELAGIYGGDLTYCPICGRRLQYDEDGDSFCPKCEKSAWELAQERRKLDKEHKNESVEENPDDNIEGTEWYSTDIKEIPYGKNNKRIKNRKLVDIDKEPVRNPVNEGLEDSKENAAIIRTALASGSLDRDAFIDYVLTNTPDEMLSGAVNFIGTSNFDTEDDLDFLGDGVDVTDSFVDDLFIDEDTLEDGSVITLKDYSKGDTTALQDGDNSTITMVQNDSEPACDDCDDLPDGVDITLVDVDDDKPLEEEKPLQEMGPLAATLLTAVAPVVADKVMDKVLPEEKEDENKVDDEVYGNADDDDVDIKGI